MANVTGGDDQNYSRRGRASRFYEEVADPNAFQRFMSQIGGMGQSMASAVGLGGGEQQQQAGDPRITGNYDPTGQSVTTGGGGRGTGTGADRVTSGGSGGGGRAPVTGAPTGGGQPTPPRNALFDRRNLLGGAVALPTAGFAVQELIEGRPLSAAAGGLGGLATGGVASAVTAGLRASPNPLLKAAGYAVPALAAAAGTGLGSVAESAKAEGKLFGIGKGQPIAGKEGSLSEQLGATEKAANIFANMDERTARTYIDTQRQLGRNAAELDLEILKRQQPIVEQAQRNALVRQQALINTMGQNYAMLGTVATAGKLALGSQSEAGANLRTALTANPYSNAVLSAPSISF